MKLIEGGSVMDQVCGKREARRDRQGSAEPWKGLTAGLALLFMMSAAGCGGDLTIGGEEPIDSVPQEWPEDGKNGVTPAILSAGHLGDVNTFPAKINSALEPRPIKLCGSVFVDPVTGETVCILQPEWEKWLYAYGPGDPITLDRYQLLRAMTHCSMEPHAIVQAPGFPGIKGMFGVYPQWRVTRLEMSERAVLSACVAAKVNAFGAEVPIAFIGPDVPQPISDPTFLYQEGAYYGDHFGKEPRMMACSGKRQDGGSYVIGKNLRVCGEPNNKCHIAALGACAGTANMCQAWDGDGASEHCLVATDGIGNYFKSSLMVYLQVEPKILSEDPMRCGLSGKEPCNEEPQ
jgi:hypothetical protein